MLLLSKLGFSNKTPKRIIQENNGIQQAKVGPEGNKKNVIKDGAKIPINTDNVKQDVMKRPKNTNNGMRKS